MKEEEKEEGEGKEEEDDQEGKEEGDEVVGQVDDNGPRRFILPLIWTVNDFYPNMS